MKYCTLLYALWVVSAVPLLAQNTGSGGIKFAASDPTGIGCSGNAPLQVYLGAIYTCQGGAYAVYGGSGGGSVISVSSGSLPPLFNASVANSTTTPAISFSLNSASANEVFASPDGSAGSGSYRHLVLPDLPTGYLFSNLGSVPSLVNSFDGRTGAVTPESGDYAAFYQATGNYITGLTGDATASGPGSVALTLATVNSSPGACGDATHVCQVTTNGKGLVTGQNSVAITGTGVTSFNSRTGAITPQSGDYSAFYQATGNYLTGLTGDVTASGPGSSPATLAAVNSSPGACGDAAHVCEVTTDTKGRVTAQSAVAITGTNGIAVPPSGTNCVVKYGTGTSSSCVPTGSAGYVYQDGSGNVSISSGTGAIPSAINYTPAGTNAGTITQQTKNQEFSALTEWKNGAGITATCPNSSEDETSALDNAAAASITGIVYIPANTHCYISNWAARSNTKLYCIGPNSGLSHFAPGTTSSLITGSFVSNFEIHGCLLDGKGIASSQPFLSFGNSTNIVIDANIFQNVGSATTLTTAIQYFKTSGRVTDNWATSGDTGQFLVVDDGATAGIRQDILTNHLSGMKTNAILMENSGGIANLNYGDFLIHGNDISNLTDEQNGTGQFGNGILITNILGGEESNNNINGSLWSGIRHGQNSGMGNDHDNLIYNTLDNGIYCSEEGGFGNHCHGNHLYNTGGLSSTNQSLRIINLPDVLEDNWVYGGDTYAFHCEGCVLRHNHAVNAPMGYQLGAGSSTGGSIVENNECIVNQLTGTGGTPNSAVPVGQPMAACFFVDPTTSSSLIEKFNGNNLGSGWQLPVGIIGVNNNQLITNITQANPAVVTVSGTPGGALAVGNQACFFFVESMTQINGYCPVITAVSGSNVTVSLDTTSFSPWVSPTNGSYPSIWGMWNANTSTPIQGLGSTDQIRDMDIPYSIINVGGIAQGSAVWATGAHCTSGALGSGSNTVWAIKSNGNGFTCQ